MFNFSIKKKIETLLSIELNKDVKQIQYYSWQPSSDLLYCQNYIYLRASEQFLDEFIHHFDLSADSPHLPTNWQLPEGVQLNWWPKLDNADNCYANDFGYNGSIVLQRQNLEAFIIVIDSGHKSGTDGPW